MFPSTIVVQNVSADASTYREGMASGLCMLKGDHGCIKEIQRNDFIEMWHI